VRGDLYFLSREGVSSLQGARTQGNIEEALLSKNIKAFDSLTLGNSNAAYAVTDSAQSQYIISFPVDGVAKNNSCYVLDYTNPESGAWTVWDGHAIGNAYMELRDQQAFLIAGRQDLEGYNDPYAAVFIMEDSSTRYSDDSYPYISRIVTKAFTQGDEVLKKRYHRWFASLRLTGTQLGLVGYYRYDQETTRTNKWEFNLNTEATAGDKWNLANWDTGVFATPKSVNKTLRYRMHGSGGRFAQSAQFMFESSSRDQGMTFSSLGFNYSAATSRYTDRTN
jgi:hypothetical protein